MECSLFRNLNQRKVVNSRGYPNSAFFIVFTEVKKNTRFSEVYMESVTAEPVSTSRESSYSSSDELN
ncbi:hypothetical protein E2542_SST28509 [Spatholobus suberectus]|nr:hypothetical protein E2542_SST28509 [Spatholobus suberectus]